MTIEIAAYLAEQKRLTEAATEGPWRFHVPSGTNGYYYVDPLGTIGHGDVTTYGANAQADAEFIAAARTSVPKLIAAVEAALSEHWSEPYAQGPDYCAGCEHRWPCDTYRAIEAALGGEGE